MMGYLNLLLPLRVQFRQFEVDNYLEAAGIILAIKKGINLKSIKRPLKKIQKCTFSD